MKMRKRRRVDDPLERFYGPKARLVGGHAAPSSYPKLSPIVPIDDTFYVVNGRGNLMHMVTITPKGLWLGWDGCQVCMGTVNTCECGQGITLPASVAHGYVKDGGVLPVLATSEYVPLPPRLALREPVVSFRRRAQPDEVVAFRRRRT